MKKSLSVILSLVMAGSLSITALAADTTIINPNTTGDSTINMLGKTIPTPTYSVTIPEKLEFGTVEKKIKSVSDAEATAKTAEKTVAVNYSNLFTNQKNITVTVNTNNELTNGADKIAFDLYEKGTGTDTKITAGTTLFAIAPTSADSNVTTEKQIYATLDQRLIKASGIFAGTVTFTVAMADIA